MQKTLLFLVVLVLLCSSVLADDFVQFDYQGRIVAQDLPFTGTGALKLAIVNDAGDVTLWSNDNTSVAGSEPTASFPVEVDNGIFSIQVGDTSLGMEPINGLIFNANKSLKLRVWFGDNKNPIQPILPDRKIANPRSLRLTEITTSTLIYVDGSTGNDAFSGLSAATPKKTIQSAIDMLPSVIEENVVVDIADGTYREEVYIQGISVKPLKTLTLLGDETVIPSASVDPKVRISGADVEGGPRVRNYCVCGKDSSGIVLKGLLLDTAGNATAFSSGQYEVVNCKANSTVNGFNTGGEASATYRKCVSINNYTGFLGGTFSYIALDDCSALNNTAYGIFADQYVGITLWTGCDISNNGAGIFAQHHCFVRVFAPPFNGKINNNAGNAIELRYQSHVRNAITHISMSGNANGIVTLYDSFAQN